MALSDFLDDPENMHAREELFNHKLLFDLKSASAVAGAFLRSHYSDVDHDGFDVILEDNSNLKRIQLKTVKEGGDTTSWGIHKSVLRPQASNCEELGLMYPNSVGVEGGVVLIEYAIDENDDVSVSYFFTDIYVLNAIALGYIQRHGNTVNATDALRAEIQRGDSTERVSVSRRMFVQAASTQHLLRLIGLQSNVNYAGWRLKVLELSRIKWGPTNPDDFNDTPVSRRTREYQNQLPDVMNTVCGGAP